MSRALIDTAQFLTQEEADLVSFYRNCAQVEKQMLAQLALKFSSAELAKAHAAVPGIFAGVIQQWRAQ